MRKRYVSSKRHTIQVDFDDYLLDLDKERRAGRRACPRRRLRAPGRRAHAREALRRLTTAGRPELGKRELTKQANRAAILEAGREVFAELGYGAATVRDIVRETDLATGTFYNYFPDKEAVLRALLDEAAAEARVRIRDAPAPRRPSLEDFVRVGFRAYFEFLLEDPPTFELLRRNAGTIRAMFDEPALGAGTEELAADLAGRRSRPGGCPAHDVELMAAAMIGAGFEVGVRMLERGDLDAAVEFVTTVFVAGLNALAR